MKVAVVFGSKAGVGGLGHSVSSAITALANGRADIHAFGPGAREPWSLGDSPKVTWHLAPSPSGTWIDSHVRRRWAPGALGLQRDRALGEWASREVQQLRPDAVYLFTQVGLETLRWARQAGVPTMLDNPNGHIRNFFNVVQNESRRWCGHSFAGHPVDAMVERVEEEYALADAVHMYSEWGRRSMTSFGVPDDKLITILPSVNLAAFSPVEHSPNGLGPLRICYAGSVDLRKGFAYLLRAVRRVGARHVHVHMLGATGDRYCAHLLQRESEGLSVIGAPGDPVAAYRAAELFALPTLEDGLPFVLAEAMASGLPAISTSEAGAAQCLRPGHSGWVVPAGDADALASAIDDALSRRSALHGMGREARIDAEAGFGPHRLSELAAKFYSLQ